MDLSVLANTIIVIGGVTVAIVNILKFFNVPLKFINKQRDKSIQKVVEESVPLFLEKAQKNTDNKLDAIEATLQDIKTMNEEQNKTLESVKKGQLDMLRQNIMRIYNQYSRYRAITNTDKIRVTQSYKDYTALGGNSYIENYYNDLDTWKVMSDEYFSEKFNNK